MARWKGRQIELIKSEKGSLHCFQACFIMSVRALTGEELTLEQAEELTGFVAGRETWPHKGFLSWAKRGIRVRSIERLDPHRFIDDPDAEIERLAEDPGVADYIRGITDAEKETILLRECLRNPLVEFVSRPPRLEELEEGLANGWLPIVTLDYGVLHETGEYEGHMVVVTAFDKRSAKLYDPGPPGEGGKVVPTDLFRRAVYSPSEGAGQLMLLQKT